MKRRWPIALLPALTLAACATTQEAKLMARHARFAPNTSAEGSVPAFAADRYEPFNREDAVAIAEREWTLFGRPVDDDPPGSRPPPSDPSEKPERQPGLWQRIGEYWWIGQGEDGIGHAWTGKHDDTGAVFPFQEDGHYAWSAAFISYVMRTAGAGEGFPYAADHATYIEAAVSSASPILKAWRTSEYAPRPGDLVCLARGASAGLTYDDLATADRFPAHCDIVVAAAPGMLSVVGGNVDDAVTMKHVPVGADGRLASADGSVFDTRYPWLVVLQVLFEAESEPASDQ